MLPQRLNRKVIYKSRWINLYVDRVVRPSGKIIERQHFLDYPYESVVVVLTNKEKKVCFLKALRYTTQRIDWELPAGGVEKGESILRAAEREVKEETAFLPKKLTRIYTFNPSNGMSNQTTHVFFGKVARRLKIKFDTDEVESVHWLSREEIGALLKKNGVRDGISLLALLLFFASPSR